MHTATHAQELVTQQPQQFSTQTTLNLKPRAPNQAILPLGEWKKFGATPPWPTWSVMRMNFCQGGLHSAISPPPASATLNFSPVQPPGSPPMGEGLSTTLLALQRSCSV